MNDFFKSYITTALGISPEDFFTCIFDLVFLYFGYQNNKALYRDKEVKGFDWRNVLLAVLWNIWSIVIIYPSAGLYYANVINMIYVITQVVWILMAWHYRRHPQVLKDRPSGFCAAENE